MLSTELIDEVIDVSLKKQFISKEFIEKIIFEVINNSDKITKKLFNKVTFEEDDWDIAFATANLATGKINIKYEYIIDYYTKCDNISFFKINLIIIQILLHEITHLKEKGKILLGNYESKIIKYGRGEYFGSVYFYRAFNKTCNTSFANRYCEKKYKLFYEQNYKLIPTERIADAVAYREILDSLKCYPNFLDLYFNEYKAIEHLYFKVLKRGYERLNSGKYSVPIIDYFKAIRRVDDLEKIGFNLETKTIPNEIKDFDLETKMMYGFPITHKEIIEFNKIKRMTRR